MNQFKLDLQAKLLIFAFVISPFTLLRVGVLGLGEVIFLVYFLLNVSKKISKQAWKRFYITHFWIFYLFISIFGLAYNNIILDRATGTITQTLFDFAAYTMVLFSSFLLEYIIIINKTNTYLFLKYAFFFLSTVLSSLFIISFFTPTLFGLPLKYYHFFAPLVKNLHQISMIMSPLVFIGVKIFRQEKGLLLRTFILILITFNIVMTLNTGSTKAMLGIIVGSIVFVIMSFLSTYGRPVKYLILLLLSIFSLFILMQTNVVGFLERGFVEADLSGARAYLYTHGFSVGLNSWIVGHGTGPHIEYHGHFMDAHQTYLTVFLQTGLIGLCFFIALTLRIINKDINQPSLLAAFSAILIYATGGDILRRLPIWIMLIFFFHYSILDEPDRKKNPI